MVMFEIANKEKEKESVQLPLNLFICKLCQRHFLYKITSSNFIISIKVFLISSNCKGMKFFKEKRLLRILFSEYYLIFVKYLILGVFKKILFNVRFILPKPIKEAYFRGKK